MKRNLLLIPGALILIATILAGCYKIKDWKDIWHQHNTGCRIKKISSYRDGDTVVATFNYNHKGNPVSIITNQPSTGRPHMFFRYDHKGRLKELVAPYSTDPNSNYEFWNIYRYDRKGRIIGDTSYGFGWLVNNVPQPSPDFKSYASYEYDGYDRIIKVVRTYLPPNISPIITTEEYFYDGYGNLELWRRSASTSPTPIDIPMGPYGNKRNIRHTDKLWMFIDRNYSRNNEAGAVAFNSAKLPTRYDLSGEGSIFAFYSIDLTHSNIVYNCR